MKKANRDIRAVIYECELRHYQIADALNVQPHIFSGMLQRELNPAMKKAIFDTIRDVREREQLQREGESENENKVQEV